MAVNTTIPEDAVMRRLYARGQWKLDSVAHFGGDEIGAADMCLLRDADGQPFIPAASIAGAARSFLARQSLCWAEYREGQKKETASLKRLFGGAGKEDTMSALIVADASCEQAATSIRDGVRVDTETGSAADKEKFDVEVVERGTAFELHLECVIRHGDDDGELQKLFLALLYGFQQGDVRLGARTRRGYGRGKVASWEIRDLKMDCPADVMAWLRDDAWSRPRSKSVPTPLPSDLQRSFHIEADFVLHTSLLIRSAPADPKSPDMVQLQSAGKPVVPGTSFAGAFRHRAALIAATIGWRGSSANEDAVSDLFGPVHKQQITERQKGLWASRVWIEEEVVQDVASKRQHRVAIDRFTGGSLPNALFDEEPVFPQRTAPHLNLKLKLTLEEPHDAEIGLLLLTLRDFWNGHAALGGGTSNGRGTLNGVAAKASLEAPASKTEWKIAKGGKNDLTLKAAAFLESCVRQAQCPPDRPPGSRRPREEKATNAERNA